LVDSSVAESSVVEGVVWEVMQISFQESRHRLIRRMSTKEYTQAESCRN